MEPPQTATKQSAAVAAITWRMLQQLSAQVPCQPLIPFMSPPPQRLGDGPATWTWSPCDGPHEVFLGVSVIPSRDSVLAP